MQFSDQALGAVMMALQKSLLEQSDIVPVLKDFNFKQNEDGELFVMNPPLVKMSEEADGEVMTAGDILADAIRNSADNFDSPIKGEMDP